MTTNTDTPSQGIGLSEAASQFEALLSGPPEKQTPEPEAAEASPADEEAEALEALASEDETPASDEEAGAEDEEAPANDEDADEASDPMDQLVTVKIDGKEEQIPLKEAINGYQRQADYSRKTAAVAEERKQVHAMAQQIQTERAQYAQLLTALQQQMAESVQQEPNWERLYAEDPLEYVRQKDLHRERQERLQAATVEQQRVMALMQEQQSQELRQVVQQGRERLTEMIPAWKDQSKWDNDRVRLRQYGQQLGYSEEELSQVYDPRAVVAVYKAMRYDEIMAKRPAPNPQTGPKPMRAGSPQTAPARRTGEITRQKQRLAKTGNVKDAAKLFESIL
jgi:hypothetical protein